METELKKIKYPVLELTRVDFVIEQLRMQLRQYSLNQSELTILAYFYLSTDPLEDLVKHKVFTSHKSIENCVSNFRKLKLLQGRAKKTILNPGIRIIEEDYTMSMVVKLLPTTLEFSKTPQG